MKRLLSIELYEEHQAANFYVIRFLDEAESLMENFVDSFSDEPYLKDMQVISQWIERIGQRGALERYFKPEAWPNVKAIPLPPPKSILRLYCVRVNDQICVLVGGKDKTVQRYQQDAKLDELVSIGKQVGKKLLTRIKDGRVSVKGKQLEGKLTLEIEI